MPEPYCVSDIMMPVMDGVEMMRKLKADDAQSHIPRDIADCQGESDSDREEGYASGADNICPAVQLYVGFKRPYQQSSSPAHEATERFCRTSCACGEI